MNRAAKVAEYGFYPETSTKEVNMDSVPRYEIKYFKSDDWQEISDIQLMEELYKIHNRATPAIKQMLGGRVLQTPDAYCRLKWKSWDS
jgi:hypothetical protein